MGEIQVDLGAEKERVLSELTAFRDTCLPAFFAPGGIKPVWDDRRPLGGPDVANRPPQAVDSLAQALVEPDDSLQREDFDDFLFEKPKSDYSVQQAVGRGAKRVDRESYNCWKEQASPGVRRCWPKAGYSATCRSPRSPPLGSLPDRRGGENHHVIYRHDVLRQVGTI